MSLRERVERVRAAVEDDLNMFLLSSDDKVLVALLRKHRDLLDLALAEPAPPASDAGGPPDLVSFKVPNRGKSGRPVGLEEMNQTELVGGSAGETLTYAPTDPAMPVGAKVLVGGEIFVYGEDRRLHYSAEETRKYRGG